MTRLVYEFGPFQLKPAEHQLLQDGHPIALTHRAFAVLLILVEHAGHLIEKQELMDCVWKDCAVEEGNIAVTVSTLRKALGDDRTQRRYIETVSRHGYRFVADVRKLTESMTHGYSAKPPAEDLPITIRQPARHPLSSHNFRRLLLSATAFFIAIGIIWLVSIDRTSRAAEREIRSVAVVPFHYTNSDPDGQMSIGITDDLITKLGSMMGDVAIRPTSSVLKYAGRSVDPIAAGREQKVDAVITGTLAVSDARMRMTVEVLRINDGSIMWSGTFDKPSDELFEMEQQLEDKVAQALYPQNPTVHSKTPQSPDPEAYRMYLEGRYFWNKRSETGLRKSVEYFQNATMKDPQFALAYAGLADAYTDLAISNLEPPQQSYQSAEAAAVKALQIDSTLPEPHASLAKVYLAYRNWTGAGNEFKRAIELNPNYSVAHLRYASYLAASGRLDIALKEALRAQELDPVSLSVNSEVARIYYWSRRYQEAADAYRHSSDLDPYYPGAYFGLGLVSLARRDYSDAVREITEAKRLAPRDTEADGLLGYAYALKGDTATAHRIVEDLKRRSNREYISKYAISLVYIGLSEKNAAFDWLARACDDESPGLTHAGVDPLFDPVRSDPRFLKLLTRVGVPQGQAMAATLKNAPF